MTSCKGDPLEQIRIRMYVKKPLDGDAECGLNKFASTMIWRAYTKACYSKLRGIFLQQDVVLAWVHSNSTLHTCRRVNTLDIRMHLTMCDHDAGVVISKSHPFVILILDLD